MSTLSEVDALVTAAPSYIGYAATGAQLPYVVTRPLLMDDGFDLERALDGSAIGWDTQISLYCCGASVEASYNLALMVMGDLDGKRVAGTTLATSMGYVGAPVEGHYETQVTAQLIQGVLA